MQRDHLEHLIRASCTIIDRQEVMVAGSQAVLGSHPDAPTSLLISMEADILSLHDPTHAELIDGSIGELSIFHETFGYYAHGIQLETLTLPSGWHDRLVVLESEATQGNRGLCLSVEDIIVAKLAAGREKDREYVSAAGQAGFVHIESVRELVDTLENESLPELVIQRLDIWLR